MPPLDAREVFRASRLDEFRRYLSGEHFNGDEYTAEDFVRRLTEGKASAEMEAGTAVHRSLELAKYGAAMADDEQNGWKIRYDLDAILSLPAIREVSLSRVHAGITLYGRVDGITGANVHDIKTTATIDPDRYAESYQWRAYLWMSGRSRFVYDLLKAKVDEETRTVTITDYTWLTFYRYPAMDADVERMLEHYAEIVADLGILEGAK